MTLIEKKGAFQRIRLLGKINNKETIFRHIDREIDML